MSKKTTAPKAPKTPSFGFSKKTTPWVYEAIQGKGVGKGLSKDQVINQIAAAQMQHRQADPLDFNPSHTVRNASPIHGVPIEGKFGSYTSQIKSDPMDRLQEMYRNNIGLKPGKAGNQYSKLFKQTNNAVDSYIKGLTQAGLSKDEAMHELAKSIVEKKHLDPTKMFQDTYTGKLINKANDPSVVVSMVAHQMTDQRKAQLQNNLNVADQLEQYLNWNTRAQGKRPLKPTTGLTNLVPSGTKLTPDAIRQYAMYQMQPSQIQNFTMDKLIKDQRKKQSLKTALDTVQGTSQANKAGGKGKYAQLKDLLLNLQTGGTTTKPPKPPKTSTTGAANIDQRVAGVGG